MLHQPCDSLEILTARIYHSLGILESVNTIFIGVIAACPILNTIVLGAIG